MIIDPRLLDALEKIARELESQRIATERMATAMEKLAGTVSRNGDFIEVLAFKGGD